jgi:hypothetical protein
MWWVSLLHDAVCRNRIYLRQLHVLLLLAYASECYGGELNMFEEFGANISTRIGDFDWGFLVVGQQSLLWR